MREVNLASYYLETEASISHSMELLHFGLFHW